MSYPPSPQREQMIYPITTTLNRIWACEPCDKGKMRALEAAGKNAPDDEPITYQQIVEAVGIEYALWCCRAEPRYRKEWRLFAVWCARQVQFLMSDQRSIDALDVAERHAHGQATDEQLAAARDARDAAASAASAAAAWDARDAAARNAWDAAKDAAASAAAAWDAAASAAAAWDAAASAAAAWDAASAASAAAAWDAASAASAAAARDAAASAAAAWDAAASAASAAAARNAASAAAARNAASAASAAAARNAAWDAQRAAFIQLVSTGTLPPAEVAT